MIVRIDNGSVAEWYDRYYGAPNYFRDKCWLFRPFVQALVAEAGLSKRTTLLDAGCGQGLFTALFAEHGIEVLGVDLSSVGIEYARSKYSTSNINFEIGDVLELPYQAMFDCVFTRSCSLYNHADFATDTFVTERLIRYLKPGGVLIFDYNTRLAPRRTSSAFRCHTLEDAVAHFSHIPGASVTFCTRIECRVLGRLAFTPAISALAALVSRAAGIGGELVAFVRTAPTGR